MDIDEIIKKIDDKNGIEVDDEIIIAVSNSYISKFYMDKIIDNLPQELKDGIKIMLVNLTEKNGGIVEAIYDDKETRIYFKSYCSSDDYLYDDIGANLSIKKFEKDNRELFENIALYCKMKLHKVDEVLEKNSINKGEQNMEEKKKSINPLLDDGCDCCGCGCNSHDCDDCDDCDDCEGCGCGCEHDHE